MFYFERKTDREPIGVIILEGCTIELAEDDQERYVVPKVILEKIRYRQSWFIMSPTLPSTILASL